MTTVYVMGSLRNPRIPEVGNALRAAGYDAFDDWFAGSEIADDAWMQYEKGRGRTYWEALDGYNARHIFEYDLFHLNRSHAGVLVMPTGLSGHMELTYLVGQSKPVYVLVDPRQEFERWDVMRRFATEFCFSVEEVLSALGGPSRDSGRFNRVIEQQVREYKRAPWNSDL